MHVSARKDGGNAELRRGGIILHCPSAGREPLPVLSSPAGGGPVETGAGGSAPKHAQSSRDTYSTSTIRGSTPPGRP